MVVARGRKRGREGGKREEGRQERGRKEGKREGGRKERGREGVRKEGKEERREEREREGRRRKSVMCSFVLVMFVPQCCTFTLSTNPFSLLSPFSPPRPQWPKPRPGAEAAVNVGEGAQQTQEVYGSKRDCAHM